MKTANLVQVDVMKNQVCNDILKIAWSAKRMDNLMQSCYPYLVLSTLVWNHGGYPTNRTFGWCSKLELIRFHVFKPWDARIDTQTPKFKLVSHCWACSLIEDSYTVPCGFLLSFFSFSTFFSFCRLKCVICLDFQSKESLFLSWVQFMPDFQVKVQLLGSILYIGATKSRFF